MSTCKEGGVSAWEWGTERRGAV